MSPPWEPSHRFDAEVRPLADRHYNRRKIGSPQFVPPGRCVVLKARCDDGTIGAFWVTSWPYGEYVRHAWPGAWVCSAFRNERPDLWLSSELITAAIAHTLTIWEMPPEGLVSFVNASKTRHKRDPGRCFVKAGFERAGFTKGGLVALTYGRSVLGEPIESSSGGGEPRIPGRT